MELPAHQLVDASIAVHNWPIKPDTLCASGCAVGVEICNNNLDDDEDGLFDCLDPECNCTENECSPKQYNIWHFGYKSGLNFDTDPPTQVDGGMTDCTGMSATMCDVKGNLLFYTDGLVVYNRFHQPMPNGTFGVGDTANQSIIIPYPANANKYFIIVNYSGGQVYSSILDMTFVRRKWRYCCRAQECSARQYFCKLGSGKSLFLQRVLVADTFNGTNKSISRFSCGSIWLMAISHCQ